MAKATGGLGRVDLRQGLDVQAAAPPGSVSSRSAMANALTAIGSLMARMFSRALAVAVVVPSQPRHRFSFWNHSCWAASCFCLFSIRSISCWRLPLTLVLFVAALGHHFIARGPLAVDLAIAQGVSGVGMVGIELDHPLQMHFALLRQAMFAAPLGQLPLGGRRVGIGGPDPLVFDFLGPRTKHLFDLGGIERHLGAVGDLDRHTAAGATRRD